MTVGVTHTRFGELLQAFSTEVLIAQDLASTEKEQELVRLYGDALATYRDSNTLWKESERFESHNIMVRCSPVDILCPGVYAATPIFEKYGIPTKHHKEIPGFEFDDASFEDAVPRVWTVASERLAKADDVYWANKEGRRPH